MVPTVVKLLTHKSEPIGFTALRRVGNFVSGDDDQTQMVLNRFPRPAFLLQSLGALLASPIDKTQKKSAWTISNITAGSQNQIQALESRLVLPLIRLRSRPKGS